MEKTMGNYMEILSPFERICMGLGLPPPILENPMETTMENETESRITRAHIWIGVPT